MLFASLILCYFFFFFLFFWPRFFGSWARLYANQQLGMHIAHFQRQRNIKTYFSVRRKNYFVRLYCCCSMSTAKILSERRLCTCTPNTLSSPKTPLRFHKIIHIMKHCHRRNGKSIPKTEQLARRRMREKRKRCAIKIVTEAHTAHT